LICCRSFPPPEPCFLLLPPSTRAIFKMSCELASRTREDLFPIVYRPTRYPLFFGRSRAFGFFQQGGLKSLFCFSLFSSCPVLKSRCRHTPLSFVAVRLGAFFLCFFVYPPGCADGPRNQIFVRLSLYFFRQELFWDGSFSPDFSFHIFLTITLLEFVADLSLFPNPKFLFLFFSDGLLLPSLREMLVSCALFLSVSGPPKPADLF